MVTCSISLCSNVISLILKTQTAEELRALNRKVENDIAKLRAEKEELNDMLESHNCVALSQANPSPSTAYNTEPSQPVS